MGFEDGESMENFTEEDEKKMEKQMEKQMEEELNKVNKPTKKNGDRIPFQKPRPAVVPNVPKEVKDVVEADVPIEYTKAIKASKVPTQPKEQREPENNFLVVKEIPQQPVRVVPTENGQVTLLTLEEAITEILRILRTLEK
jgi:hypothetical protein